MRTDVALSEVSRFLDKALLGNVSQVEIVHGRGTGVLRKEVHRLLRDFPAVSEFRLAPEDMGGDGMTIVDFK
jgi:DNA mismatch repair protein MutS2